MSERYQGVYAALLTPRAEGRFDEDAFSSIIDFVLEAGVDGVCIGGGTSEYPHVGLEERKRILSSAARRLQGSGRLIAAIGAGTLGHVLELGRHALAVGSDALLLPMPHFYPYAQEDLDAFVRHVAQDLQAPLLLYNLPSFTNGLDVDTSRALLASEPNVVGIKDSSGDATALAPLADRQDYPGCTLLCGADGLFLRALEAGWDGCISGLAGFCPELLVSLYHLERRGDLDGARGQQELLDELVEMVGELPFPWTIHLGSKLRRLSSGELPLPLAASREPAVERLQKQLQDWLRRLEESLRQSLRRAT